MLVGSLLKMLKRGHVRSDKLPTLSAVERPQVQGSEVKAKRNLSHIYKSHEGEGMTFGDGCFQVPPPRQCLESGMRNG